MVVKVGRPMSVPMDGKEEVWMARYQEEMARIRGLLRVLLGQSVREMSGFGPVVALLSGP